MSKSKAFPKEILVFQCDEVDGEPVYGVCINAAELPEEVEGQKVGVYTLNQSCTFQVKRILK